MNFFNFEFVNNTIHIQEYPEADKVLKIPDDYNVKRLKDMLLHWYDLKEAKSCLEALDDENSDVVNKALVQNAIILFYKCFGNSEFRDNSLKKDKVLAGLPLGAKNVFDYYKVIRDKFIAHDESRYAQVISGIILETSKFFPFVDTVQMVGVVDIFKTEKQKQSLEVFYLLIIETIAWTERTIDQLRDMIAEIYQKQQLSYFKDFEPLTFNTPTEESMFKKRY